MADFQNHQRFTLRCLSKDLIPVSIKLKTTVKTPKGIYIVRKAERMLMNERIRLINTTQSPCLDGRLIHVSTALEVV